jgi:KDO2-lipid IV(A) lauroyltransferase
LVTRGAQAGAERRAGIVWLGDGLERLAVQAARGLIALLARLPHTAVLAGFRLLADCAFALRIRRRVLMQNLDLVYGSRLPQAEKRRIARSANRNLFLMVAEMARGAHPLARDEVAGMLDFEPRALTDELAADPRGSVIAVAHSGNFDLAGVRFVRDYGRAMSVVMKPLGTPRFNEALIEVRKSHGLGVITTEGRTVLLRVARSLAAGGILCMLPDQFARRAGVVVDFLGVPASTHAGPAAVVLRARACRLFVAVVVRQQDGPRLVCHVREIRELPRSDDPDADVVTLTQRICDVMGEVVLKHPESYLWHHRRWRSRGERGAPPAAGD